MNLYISLSLSTNTDIFRRLRNFILVPMSTLQSTTIQLADELRFETVLDNFLQ